MNQPFCSWTYSPWEYSLKDILLFDDAFFFTSNYRIHDLSFYRKNRIFFLGM